MKTLIWDAHSCLPLSPDTDISILHRHHSIGATFISINIGMDFNPLAQILQTIASFQHQIKNDAKLILVESLADVNRAFHEDKLAVSFDLEGSVPLLENPDVVMLYRKLGVRQIHLAYNRSNTVAGGCHDRDAGLSTLGRSIVNRISQEGIFMDLSHTGYRSAMEITDISPQPVVYSHANPYSLLPHPRNIFDDQIQACAERGGVICLNGAERFLGDCSIARFVDHVSYVSDLVGTSHVGIGLDTMFSQSGVSDLPVGLDSEYWWPKEHYAVGVGKMKYLQPESIPLIQNELETRGFHEEEINGIMGQNMYRLARECW